MLSIARQIARALEAAHARGIVHRDLKPANLKVTGSGVLKVLDFGLSKALEGSTGLADSLTKEHRPGAVLGTAAYMSPEQVRGRAVDLRTDIWTFGCVLFEALTGRRAFAGDSAAVVVSKVLDQEPDFDAIPAGTPGSLQELIRRCLTKDVERRLASIADARAELDRLGAEPSQSPSRLHPAQTGGRVRRVFALAAAVLAGVAVGLLLRSTGPTPLETPRRFAISIPAGDELVDDAAPGLALSPDGRVLVYRARRDGVVHLFLRRLDSVEVVPIAGTEGARAPFFSTDGRWIGYIDDRGVSTLPADGGVPRLISPARAVSACWAPDGAVLYASATDGMLHAIAPDGGAPSPVASLAGTADGRLREPQALPDGRAVLLDVRHADGPRVAVLDGDTGVIRVLTSGSQPRLLASGDLVIHRSGSLWVAPFDVRARRLLDEPERIVEGVHHDADGGAQFAVAPDGLIAYVAAGVDPRSPTTSVIRLVTGWSAMLAERRLGLP